MAIGDIIVGVDIGTEKVTAVIGEVNSFNQIEIICTTSAKCNGIKKTKIISDEEVARIHCKSNTRSRTIGRFKNKLYFGRRTSGKKQNRADYAWS